MSFAIVSYSDITRAVFSAMETGNAARAATLVREYGEYYPEQAKVLRQDVLLNYNEHLET